VSATLPGFEAYEWNGVFVPHGTPAPIVQKLNGGINAALRDPNVIARFEQLNIETRTTTPQEFGTFVDEQMARWSKVVKDANIRLG
jgi:tripartite-type tricarboxylate transporter receptor subunit TctC